MRHAILAPLLLLAPVATAADYESEPQSVVFEGGNTVLTQQYQLPLILNVGFILESIGFVANATADSELYLRMEGESQISWPDPNGEGSVRQVITPLPSGSDMGLDTTVSVSLDFIVDVDLIFTNPGPVRFVLFSRSVPFRPNITGFEPFLLPGQPTQRLRLDADPQGGGINLPFNFSLLDLGVVGVSVGIIIQAIPITYSIVHGVSLDTMHEQDQYRISDPTFPTSIALYENTGSVDLETRYTVDTDSVVGYRFVGDGGLTVEIFGQPIDFYINLFDFTINLFTGSERAVWSSGTYSHPIPTIDLPVPEVDFGTIPVGDQRTFTVPVNNDGQLALDAVVVLDGDAPFAAAPVQVYAAPGGQDAVIVTFAPTEAGEFTATLKLRNNDPLDPKPEISIIGRAEKAAEVDTTETNDDPLNDGTATTLYTGCGCDTPGGAQGWVMLSLAGLIAARRRRPVS